VSNQTSDTSFIPLNVSSEDKFSLSQNLLSLFEVSPVGEIWDKHRANADKVSDYYAQAGEGSFNRYAWRVKMCSEWLEFQLVSEEPEGILQFKLSDAKFCRVRHCPVCQWRRSLMWKARAYLRYKMLLLMCL
jgi:plasmid rolling circle replication initiator protein Rep